MGIHGICERCIRCAWLGESPTCHRVCGQPAGIDERDAAALLRGYTIEVLREEFAPTEEDEFYWTDLLGMAVHNREGVVLGEVANLLETGAHDVLVVQGEHGEKLIPFVSQYVDDVDTENRIIICDWGLDYCFRKCLPVLRSTV